MGRALHFLLGKEQGKRLKKKKMQKQHAVKQRRPHSQFCSAREARRRKRKKRPPQPAALGESSLHRPATQQSPRPNLPPPGPDRPHRRHRSNQPLTSKGMEDWSFAAQM
jgi:hypothetical protein